MKTAYVTVLVACIAACPAMAAPMVDFGNVVFQQDFQSSTDVADYESRNAAPDSGQFTQINDGSIVTDASNNFLRITRASNDFENVIRRANNAVGNYDLGLTDELIKFEYDMRFDSVTAASNIAGSLDLADDTTGFDSHSRRNRLEWERRNNTTYRYRGAANTTDSSGWSTVTVFGNKSGAAVDYIGPDGGTHTLDNNERQIWLDNNLDITTGVGTDGFEQFRVWHMLTGSVDFDNFKVSTVPEPASLVLVAGGAMCMAAKRRRTRQV